MKGKRALVVGASGDIGRAVTSRLLDEGMTVVAHCFRVPDQEMPGIERLSRVDLTTPDGARALVAGLDWDGLDLLVNALGGARPRPFAEVSDEEWAQCLALNLSSVFWVMREAQPLLARAAGAIVNITSVAALTGGAFGPHYAAAKAGLIGLTRSAAREWGPLGIRANAVAPGPVESRMTGSLTQAQLDGLLAATALGRVVTAEEVADAVFWLATASAITGQTVVVDGGRCFL